MSGGGSISGTVTASAGGAPLSGICVNAMAPGDTTFVSATTTTAADGTYLLTNLAPASYKSSSPPSAATRPTTPPSGTTGPRPRPWPRSRCQRRNHLDLDQRGARIGRPDRLGRDPQQRLDERHKHRHRHRHQPQSGHHRQLRLNTGHHHR